MLPHDLEPKRILLPPGPKDGIVLITGGTSLHFLHFGYRIQQEFPGMVRAWFAKAPLPPQERTLYYRLNRFLRRPGKAGKKALRIIEEMRGCIDRVRFSGVLGDYNKEEMSVFLADAQRLKPFAKVQPQPQAEQLLAGPALDRGQTKDCQHHGNGQGKPHHWHAEKRTERLPQHGQQVLR